MARGSVFVHPTQQIAIIGQGYVGLPLALLFAAKAHTVYGIDADPIKIEALLSGKSYLPDIQDEDIQVSLNTGRYLPTTSFEFIENVDTVVICVPTPLNHEYAPDLTILQKAVQEIGKHLKRGQLVILESSTYPGTTREIVQPLLERECSLTAGIDFHIGYSPERIDPGNEEYRVEQIPKIISGLTTECTEAAYLLYSSVFERVVKVSSLDVAELTKLVENTYRLINISFMNEMAVICDKMGIDIWEVIEAAKTKPFGFTAFYPGPGIGGHCIPVDPLYLQWKASKFGIESRFIQLSDEVNRAVPHYIASRVRELVASKFGAQPTRILLYGVAYKKDINDIRESTALELMQIFADAGYAVSYHDPYIPQVLVNDELFFSIELDDALLENTNCVIIFTDHSIIPLEQIITHAPLIFDTRNVTSKLQAHPHVFRLGAGGPGAGAGTAVKISH